MGRQPIGPSHLDDGDHRNLTPVIAVTSTRDSLDRYPTKTGLAVPNQKSHAAHCVFCRPNLDGYISFDIMPTKSVAWLGDSRERVRDFPNEARGRMGFELWEVQQGKEPSDWKPMPAIGIGVNEVRVREGGAFRLIYVAKFPEAVYVLHAFQKKAHKTPKADIDLARIRYRAMLKDRT